MDVVSQRTCAVMVHHIDIVAMDKDKDITEEEKGNPTGYEILGHEKKVYKLKKTL
jgi:hypothetical protein